MRPQDFYTNERASKGVRVDLVDPSGNREWVTVRSVLSPEFAAAVSLSWASIPEILTATSDSIDIKRRRRVRHAQLVASLIAGWSLPADVDPIDVLVSNPRLRRQIERIAEDPAIHFGVSND